MQDNTQEISDTIFFKDVISGLSLVQKYIQPKYFYDEKGSLLFDRICLLDEYYITRTETTLLKEKAEEIKKILGDQHLIEFGSGSSTKTRLLLDSNPDIASYIPIDISEKHLEASVKDLKYSYPNLIINPICADFTTKFTLPKKNDNKKYSVFFPGSTIGNFNKNEARNFLLMVASIIGTGGGLLIGVDIKKDPETLYNAYNDQKGITAAFNLNLLTRINNELNGNFDLKNFKHEARYEKNKGRMEMHLISLSEHTVLINNHPVSFKKNESIHTENSHKYTVEEFHDLGNATGFKPTKTWVDKENLFSIHYLTVPNN